MLSNKILLMLSNKKLNLLDTLILSKILLNLKDNDYETIKLFLDNYYNINSFNEDFYYNFLNTIHSHNFNTLITILLKRNIYDLITYLNYDQEHINGIEYLLSPYDYSNLPSKQIKNIIKLLQNIDIKNDELLIKKLLNNNPKWLIKNPSIHRDDELMKIAIKMYLSIGYNNTLDILNNTYSMIDYEIIHYLFNNLNITKINSNNNLIFNNFLFNNKKDTNNNMRLLLNGNNIDLFINFDYFYNNIEYFINNLGTKLNKSKVNSLISERYTSKELEYPSLNNVVMQDMLSSYYHTYGINEEEKDIISKNMNAYSTLKLKTKSSIIKVEIPKIDGFTFELLPLNDMRNLVMGYRAGNCFRINGDAFMLFNNFLTNPHMRILSISNDEYKDFGMVLLMRNGNVLIAQGIETSKRVPNYLMGVKLYNATRKAIKYIMDKMNREDDEIVVSIIGLTNSNTSLYNNHILPFLINPLINNNLQYYNGIDNYQALLDIKENHTLQDIKLYTPSKYYYDTNKIYIRDKYISTNNVLYNEIEKILISLRYKRFKENPSNAYKYYSNITYRSEIYTICTLDWFITIYEDGYIDTYISTNNEEIVKEYNEELNKIKNVNLTKILKKK